MKTRLLVLCSLIFVAQSAFATTYDVAVTAAGDAAYRHYHDRWGGFNWWEAGQNPNSVSYWYDGPPAQVDSSTVYAQYSLSGIPTGETITAATLNIYLLSVSNGFGEEVGASNIYHRTNSSGANGDATQGSAGDVWVGKISVQPLGWVSFDVRDLIINDLASGYAWSAFHSAFATPGGTYGGSGASFGSGENSEQASFLRIVTECEEETAVPEPATALLLFGALPFIRRRKAA